LNIENVIVIEVKTALGIAAKSPQQSEDL